MVNKTQMCLFSFLPTHTWERSTKAGNHHKGCRLPTAAHQHSLAAQHRLFFGVPMPPGRRKQVHTILAKTTGSSKIVNLKLKIGKAFQVQSCRLVIQQCTRGWKCCSPSRIIPWSKCLQWPGNHILTLWDIYKREERTSSDTLIYHMLLSDLCICW